MASQGTGDKGQPTYDSNYPPSDAADLTEVAQYAADVGNARVGSTSERTAFSNNGNATEGLAWRDTTLKRTFYWESGAWVLEVWGTLLDSLKTNATGFLRVPHSLGKKPSVVIMQDYGTVTSGKRNYVVTDRTAVDFAFALYDGSDGTLLRSTTFSALVQVVA